MVRKTVLVLVILSEVALAKSGRAPSIDPDYPTFSEARIELPGINNDKPKPEVKPNDLVGTLNEAMSALNTVNKPKPGSKNRAVSPKFGPSFNDSEGAFTLKDSREGNPEAANSDEKVGQSK